MSIKSIPLDQAYRLLNHGPTVLVSAKADHLENVMTASWACALDFFPAKVTVVLDKMTFTRKLVEKSGLFALQVPVFSQVNMAIQIGSQSFKDNNEKLKQNNVRIFYQDNDSVPLVEGCAAWLICKLIPNIENQENHDLFIGEVLTAWADDRIFENGRWKLDDLPNELKTFHYVAGGQVYITGQGYHIENSP